MKKSVYFSIVMFSFSLLYSGAGDLIWKIYGGDYYNSKGSPVISEVMNGERLVYINDNWHYTTSAYQALTGQLKWKTDGIAPKGIPFYKNQTLYIGTSYGYTPAIYALNAMTGEIKWKYQVYFDGVISTPYVSNGVLYAAADSVYAINALTGEMIWDASTSYNPEPSYSIVHEEAGIVCSEGVDQKMGGYRKDTGERVWTARYPSARYPLAIYGDTFIHEFGPLALYADDGKTKWFTNIATSGICLVKDRIYFACHNDRKAYCISAENGEIIWESFLGAASHSGAAVANQTVYVGSAIPYLHALDIKDGTRKWVFKADEEIQCIPCIGDSIIYFNGYHWLYAVSIGEMMNTSDDSKSSKLPSKILTASPNPFSSRLSVSLTSSGAIYSLTGQLIMNLSKGKHSLDTGSWKQGVYIVKSGKETKRLAKIN